MREFVKYDGRQFNVVPAHHGVENRIVEMPQRGIGGDAAHAYIETLFRNFAANERALPSAKYPRYATHPTIG